MKLPPQRQAFAHLEVFIELVGHHDTRTEGKNIVWNIFSLSFHCFVFKLHENTDFPKSKMILIVLSRIVLVCT